MSAGPGRGPVRDPGAASERTSLAWNRTGLSAVAAGVLILHVFSHRGFVGLVLAGLLVGGGAFAYVTARVTSVAPVRLRALSLVITAAAVLGGWLAVTDP